MDRGGAETFVMNLYRAIDRDLIQFDFLVHEQRQCDYDEEIGDLGGKMYRFPRFTGVNCFSYLSKCKSFFAKDDEHPVVHGHIGSSAPMYLNEARRSGRYAIAHSHAQNYERGLPGLAFRVASAPVRNIADYFMACSREAGLDRFGTRVVEGNRFQVVPNGVDLDAFSFSAEGRAKARAALELDDVPVYGHVGRLTEVKNHAFLLRVFAQVKKAQPDAVLLLVGRGSLENQLRQEVLSLGMEEGSVRFLGVREDIDSLLQAMDVLVFPSTKEGLPVTVVEAQASGLPCALSTGIPEMAVATSTCKRIALSSGVDEWARECVRMCNETNRSRREAASKEMRSSMFDIRSIARNLTDFYLSHSELRLIR